MPESQVISSREEARFFPYSGLFHYVRNAFWTAGQDSYTFPPAQNPDKFTALTNIEPVVEGNLLRRRGYQLFNNASHTAPYTRSYVYRNLASQLRYLIFDNVSEITVFNEAGTTIVPNLFTPSTNATPPRVVESRDFAFFCDSVAADSQMWNAALASAPTTAPQLSSVAGGALVQTTYFVKFTYLTISGTETLASPESSLLVAANNLLVVSPPLNVPTAANWNVYISTTTNTETKQNTTPLGLTSSFTEPVTGLIAGAAPPTFSGSQYLINWGIQAPTIAPKTGVQSTTATNQSIAGVLLNGSTGWVSTSKQESHPWVFTTEILFKTTAAQQQGIFSFVDQQTANPTSFSDSYIWMTTGGLIEFAIDDAPAGVWRLAQEPIPFNDGFWHHLMVAFNGGNGFDGIHNKIQIYVDGKTVATSPVPIMGATPQTFNGFWRVGNVNATGVSPAAPWGTPANIFFNGTLSEAAIYEGIILTQATALAHFQAFAASGQAALEAKILAQAPTFWWKLTEISGTTAADSADANTGTFQAGSTLNSSSLNLLAAWTASTALTLGTTLVDSNGNLERVTTAGTTGTTVPVWNTNVGGTTTDGTVTWTNEGIFDLALKIGRRYALAYYNSLINVTSDISPFSAITGPIVFGQDINLTNLQVSSDPQVDNKFILATADGGDETTLFLIAEIPNSVTTFLDTIPETKLLASLVYQDTDNLGQLHGVVGNEQPPAGIFVAINHRGRMYGLSSASPGFLFFSKSLFDVTTSTGTITSRWETAWPPYFQMPIVKDFESGRGLISDGQILYIGTERHILRLIGDSPLNFEQPEIVFNETGILNQETWQMVFLEDQPVGTMWVTPDSRVMLSDFNSYHDVGLPIQDVLDGMNATASQTSWAMYVNHGAFDLYMLWIPTGSNSTPDTCCIYNLKTATWFIWKPTDSGTTGVFNIDANGIPQWLFATQVKPVYQWEATPTIFQDRINNTPVSYATTAETSFLNFGDMTLKKALNQLIVYTGDSASTVTVEGATTEADFLSPVLVKSATAVVNDPFGNKFVPLAGSVTKYHWYRFTVISPASTVKQVLSGLDVEATPIHRL